MANVLRSAALIFTASAGLGCSGLPKGTAEEPYRVGSGFVSTNDPLVPKREFPAWNPPKQFAVYRHLHQDGEQGVLFGGEWILLNLNEGGWYAEEFVEQDPVPDAEVSPLDLETARRTLGDAGGLVVPYRLKN